VDRACGKNEGEAKRQGSFGMKTRKKDILVDQDVDLRSYYTRS
jgi:hypothetical protein